MADPNVKQAAAVNVPAPAQMTQEQIAGLLASVTALTARLDAAEQRAEVAEEALEEVTTAPAAFQTYQNQNGNYCVAMTGHSVIGFGRAKAEALIAHWADIGGSLAALLDSTRPQPKPAPRKQTAMEIFRSRQR